MTRLAALVVDDDESVRNMVAASLRDEGFVTLLAASGREALDHLNQASRVDILLLDLHMPMVDGYAVLEHLRRHPQHDLPVLIFSAQHPPPSLLEALQGERRDFIAKPFDLDELQLRLRRLLRSPHAAPRGDARVYALGSLRVERGAQVLLDESWRNRPAKRVLKLLLTAHGHRYPKDELADVLWPGIATDAALNRLRVAVHALRTQLGEARAGVGAPLIVQHEGGYAFDPSRTCWTDVRAFDDEVEGGRQFAAQGNVEAALAAYQRGVLLYRGDYLCDDTPEEWAIPLARTAARRVPGHTRRDGTTASGTGAVEPALRHYRHIIALEPWREDVYRRLIAYLASIGRRREALHAFDECRRAMAMEDLEPSPATWRLRERVARNTATQKYGLGN